VSAYGIPSCALALIIIIIIIIIIIGAIPAAHFVYVIFVCVDAEIIKK
jgi:hypothetical protein